MQGGRQKPVPELNHPVNCEGRVASGEIGGGVFWHCVDDYLPDEGETGLSSYSQEAVGHSAARTLQPEVASDNWAELS